MITKKEWEVIDKTVSNWNEMKLEIAKWDLPDIDPDGKLDGLDYNPSDACLVMELTVKAISSKIDYLLTMMQLNLSRPSI